MPEQDFKDAQAAPVVVLGAGFSRAVHDAMPLLPDLGAAVLSELGEPEATLGPFNGNLEHWLSYLATDQPWLPTYQNMANRAQFLRASEAVQSIISRAEDVALRTPPPIWLSRLVWQWCEDGAQVITFNYDQLVERTVAHWLLARASTDIYAISPAIRQPGGSTGGMFGAETPSGNVLRLFKLHGSTNMYYSGPTAPVSDRIVLREDWLRWQPRDADQQVYPPRFKSLYSDLSPFIVPPTASKAPYYGNLSMQAQWREAFDALKHATSIMVIGYSFPESDLALRQFFATAQVRSEIDVINFNAVHGRRAEGVFGKPIRSLTSDTGCIERWVAANCGSIVQWFRLAAPTEEQEVDVLVNGESEWDKFTRKEWVSREYSSDPLDPLTVMVHDEWPRILDTSRPAGPFSVDSTYGYAAFIPRGGN